MSWSRSGPEKGAIIPVLPTGLDRTLSPPVFTGSSPIRALFNPVSIWPQHNCPPSPSPHLYTPCPISLSTSRPHSIHSEDGPPKHRYPMTSLHSVITRKITTWIFIAMRTKSVEVSVDICIYAYAYAYNYQYLTTYFTDLWWKFIVVNLKYTIPQYRSGEMTYLPYLATDVLRFQYSYWLEIQSIHNDKTEITNLPRKCHCYKDS